METSMKKNCWQYRCCGREPGGKHVHELGVCPAATEAKLHGTHGGQNGGRACWVVPGTPCAKGETDDYIILKYRQCSSCDFYKKVRIEENRNFLLTPELLRMLNK